MKHLSETEVKQYFELGYCSPIDVMSEHEAGELKSRLEQAEKNYPESVHSENRNNIHLVFPFLDQVIRNPVIVDCMEDILGPDIQLWGTVLFSKEPLSAGYVSWHQDATYMGLYPHDFATPWLALTHSNPESGCMRVIPGSHHEQILAHTDTFESDNILTRGQKILDIDDSDAVDLVLRPGQMSIHHPRLVHGSSPNRSKYRRIGLALQSYFAPGVGQVAGKGYATHIRGRIEKFNFELSPRPECDMDPVSVAWREQVNRNLSEILYRDAAKKRAY